MDKTFRKVFKNLTVAGSIKDIEIVEQGRHKAYKADSYLRGTFFSKRRISLVLGKVRKSSSMGEKNISVLILNLIFLIKG